MTVNGQLLVPNKPNDSCWQITFTTNKPNDSCQQINFTSDKPNYSCQQIMLRAYFDQFKGSYQQS